MFASLGNSPETEGKQTLRHSLKPGSTPQLNQQTHAGKNNESKRETQYMLMGVKQPCPLTWAYGKHRITNSIVFSTKLQAQMTKVAQITVFSIPWPSTTLVDSLSRFHQAAVEEWPDQMCNAVEHQGRNCFHCRQRQFTKTGFSPQEKQGRRVFLKVEYLTFQALHLWCEWIVHQEKFC